MLFIADLPHLGAGATSVYLQLYATTVLEEILDVLFKPNFAASLDILKVEIGSDDETTNGCESCHMRTPDEIDCSRGYEWELMKQARARNPQIVLSALPWNFPGWVAEGAPGCNPLPWDNFVGHGGGDTTSCDPFFNSSRTARCYSVRRPSSAFHGCSNDVAL